MTDSHATLAAEKYVVLTTTRKDGRTVPTPVWIAPLPGGGLGFTTELDSGKVKRIRNFPDVTLQPSSARGAVKEGTTPTPARATVLTGAEVDPVAAAIAGKYGFMVKLIGLAAAVRKLITRKEPVRAAIRLELTD